MGPCGPADVPDRGVIQMEESWWYEIRLEGQLADRWSGWFDGLTICHDSEGETVLEGPLPDQAALFGVLRKIYDLNLKLISLRRLHSTVQTKD
jgi:hypothetical protein